MSLNTVENAIREVLQLDDVKSVVRGSEVVSGRDSTGSEAIWVYVTLAEHATDWETRKRIRELLRGTAGGGEADPAWVYVRFRTEGETEER